jgi:hypothetical protein
MLFSITDTSAIVQILTFADWLNFVRVSAMCNLRLIEGTTLTARVVIFLWGSGKWGKDLDGSLENF